MKPAPIRRRRIVDRVLLERALAAERQKFGNDLGPEATTRLIVRIKEIQASLAAIK